MGYRSETRTLLRDVTSNQLGLFTLDQARQCGVSRGQVDTDLAHGGVERVYPRVFAITGVPWTDARRHLAAVLAGDEGARSTHRAGAWLWGLTRYGQKPEISVPLGRRVTAAGVRVHRSSDLPEIIEVRLGVPTTDVNRVLVDLGAVKPESVSDALDRAIARKYTTPMRVLAELNDLAARGRRGVGVMRALLDQAGVSGSHPPSVLEAKTRRLIRDSGLPQPDCELVAGANGEYRLDFCWPELRLVVEVSGWQYHSSFDAFHCGMTRQNALTVDGYALLEYSWLHVTREARRVVAEIRAAYRSRTALFV